jgi:hypothetical protein
MLIILSDMENGYGMYNRNAHVEQVSGGRRYWHRMGVKANRKIRAQMTREGVNMRDLIRQNNALYGALAFFLL